ncbi:MAG: lasso peptide biosynthesis B2 protein [Rhodothermales bacterium]
MPDRRHIVWKERRLLLGVSVLLLTLRLTLAVLPYRAARRLFDRPARAGRRAPSETYRRRVVWAVHAVGRRVLGDKPCLPEAMAVQWILRRHGDETTLRIGVRRDDAGALLAHAWLEREGQILIGGTLAPAQYQRLETRHAA